MTVLREKIKRFVKRMISEEIPLMGMTSKGEQQFYTECADKLSDMDGAIVDLGCWMCSTAISLARGIHRKQSERFGETHKVYAIDRFIWEAWMNSRLPEVWCDYQPGDSFLPEVRRRISAYQHVIELVQADLTDYSWQRGPIKILLVDAMKSWQLAQSIATLFFPSLVKGGVLIHQDFKHFYTPWIHIVQYRLRNYFRLQHDVADGDTVAFETVRQVPVEIAISATLFDDISDVEVKEAICYSMDCVHEKWKSAIAAAHVMFFIHSSRRQKAREMLALYSSKYFPPTRDFSIVKEIVNSMEG